MTIYTGLLDNTRKVTTCPAMRHATKRAKQIQCEVSEARSVGKTLDRAKRNDSHNETNGRTATVDCSMQQEKVVIPSG